VIGLKVFKACRVVAISECAKSFDGRGKVQEKCVATDFIVHDKADSVGVVVVEDVQPGKAVTGWIMETDETIQFESLDAVPLGHKIALRDLKVGDTVLKYGHDVGRIVRRRGQRAARACA
jgi:(2R)-sulfolactate sulfo-lyase subunit alpha